MVQTRRSCRLSEKEHVQEGDDGQQVTQEEEAQQPEVVDEVKNEKKTPTPKGKKKKKNSLKKQKRKEELKSKTTGVGLKISVEADSAAPTNKKIVFDDSNLPPADDDDDDDDDGRDHEVKSNSKLATTEQDEENEDNDDAVEEVKGKAARDEVMDQLKTEEKQSLKTKKKRKRKSRKEEGKDAALKTAKDKDKDNDGSDDDDDEEEMDKDFFAQLDSVRKEEDVEKKELEKSVARAAAKGKHTTFVFAQNKEDDAALSDPVQIDENIQVVVLKNPSTSEANMDSNSFATTSTISKKALLYSRNQLNDGSDPGAGSQEMKRKRNRSGEEIQPWKRARQRLSMGRSRMTKGKPAAFFKKKKTKR